MCLRTLGVAQLKSRGGGLFPPSLAYFDLNHVGSETVKDVSDVAVQIGGTNANLWGLCGWQPVVSPTVACFASLLRPLQTDGVGLSNDNSEELCNVEKATVICAF